MKNLNHIFLKKFNAVFVALLALFGFSACILNEPKSMYGTPQVDFVVKGTVVDKTNNQPIEGIKVKLFKGWFTDIYGNNQYVYHAENTDENGVFKIRGTGVGLPQPRVRFVDIDGDENGLFEDKTVEFDWKDAEQTRPPSGFWNSGELTKTINARLTPREENNEKSN